MSRAIDLKMSGSVPFVDGARIFALASGVTATNTVERLARSRPRARHRRPAEMRAWCDAFEYVQLLRLREQHRRARTSAATTRKPEPRPARDAVRSRSPHPEGSDAAGAQAAAASRDRLSRMSSASPLCALARPDHAPRPVRRWVVVDTETSGLDPERDRLLAIGGVAVDDGGILLDDSFEVVLKGEPSAMPPTSSSTASATARRRPEPRCATRSPPFATGRAKRRASASTRLRPRRAARRVRRRGLAGRRPALARPRAARRRAGARRQPSRYGGRSLDDWLAAFGIECTIRHNAAADALATAELLLRLRAIADAQGARGFDALVKAARRRSGSAAHG